MVGDYPRDVIDIEKWRRLRTRTEWADALNRLLPEPGLWRLRPMTRSGASCLNDEFVRSLEDETGRCLDLRGCGRPRKWEVTVLANSRNVTRSPTFFGTRLFRCAIMVNYRPVSMIRARPASWPGRRQSESIRVVSAAMECSRSIPF